MKKEQNKKYYYIGGIVALVIIAIIVAILVVSCNRKEKYDVQLLVDNKNYYQDKIREGETIKGITEPRKEGYTFVGWYAGDKKVDLNDPITDDTKLEARWEINTYTITIDLGNGNTVTREVNYNETVTLPEVPTRYGYIFDGWYVNGESFDADTKIGKDTTITAKWIEVSNVSYTVKHYLMGLDGKYTDTPFASETFVVKDGTTVNPQTKTYEGFTSPSGQTIVVRENGNNVINYYYERCKYEFTLVGDNGVLETLSDGKYYYGEEVVIDFTIKPGYTFEGYSEDIEEDTYVMPSKDVTIEIITSPNEDTEYTVKHYVMGLDGKYPTEPNYTDVLTGTTDTVVTVPVKELDKGFIIPSEKEITITGDGKAVVEYRYERRQFTLTLTKSDTLGAGIESLEGEGKYYYGASVTVTAKVKEGYTFASWQPGNIDRNTFTYIIPASDSTLTASATANTDTKYTVKHYVMGTDGEYPTEPTYVDNLTGTTDTTVTAPVRELGEGFIIPAEKGVTITGDGKAVVEYRYERRQFTLTLTPGTGIESLEGDGKYYYGASVVVTAKVKEGYTFEAWTPGNIDKNIFTYVIPASDTTLTASAAPNTDTTYTVKHYVMGTDGIYPTEPNYVDNLTGTTDTVVTAKVRELGEGFVIPSEKEITITGDGKAVVEYRYERRQFNLTLTPGTGIESLEGDGKYYYGASVTVTANVKEGYTFVSWQPGNIDKNTFTYVIPASDSNLTASATPNIDTKYTVKHYIMGLDGEYPAEPNYVDNLTGTTDTVVTAKVRELGEGFVIPIEKEVTITGDGKAVVEYRYERRQFNLTLTPGTGIESLEGDGKYYYGASVTVTANVKEGYTFVSWQPGNIDKNTFTYVIPASDTTLTASATANIDTKYTVKHYIMGLDGEYPAEPNYVDNLTGTTDTTVIAKVKELSSGFVIPIEKEVTITGDGKAVVEYRYERRQFTLMLAKSATLGAGIESLEGEGTYYYGTKVRVKALVKKGYTFETWVPLNVTETEFDYEIPSSNIILIASATPNTYTVTFDAGTDATFEGEKEVKVKYLEKVPEPNVEPERLGYTFAGWFDSENNEWDFENATMPYEDLALHAKWDLVEYDLKYYYLDNMNEKHYLDNGDNPSKYTIESEDITLTEISRETEGYQFVSFNSDKVKEENILSVKGSTGTIEVELKYTPIDYTIKYYYLDSEGNKQYLKAGTNPTTYNVESEDVTLTGISRETEGYRFTKFNSDKVNEANSLSLKGKTGNIEIELQYTMIDYTITYDLQDGETCTDCNTENKYTVEGKALPEPTKENFVFDGWEITKAEEETLKDTVITEIEKGTTGDLTLKAKWVKLITLEYVDEQLLSISTDLSTKYSSKVLEDERIVNVDILNTKGQMIGGINLVMYFTPLGGNIGRVVEIPEIKAIHMQYMDQPEVVCTKEKSMFCQITAISEIMTSLTNKSNSELSEVPISDLDGKTLTITVDLDGSLAKTKDKKTELVYTLNINALGYVSAEEFKETVNKVKPSVDNNNKNGQHFTIDDSDAINGNIVLRYSDENIVIGTSVFGMGMSSSLSELAQDPNIDYIEVTLPKKGTMTVRDKTDASSVASAVFSDMAQYMKEKTGDPTKDTPSITNDDLRNYKYTVKVKIVLANNGYFEKGIPTEYTITFDKKKD